MKRIFLGIALLAFVTTVFAVDVRKECRAKKKTADAEACLKRVAGYEADVAMKVLAHQLAAQLAAVAQAPGPLRAMRVGAAPATLGCGESITITAATTCGIGPPPPLVCSGGSSNVNGVCTCPGGTQWNSTNTQCVPIASAGCPGFARTIDIKLDWNAPGRISTGTFGPNDAVVVEFRTGNLDSANNNLPRISGAEWGTPPSARFAVLSATRCDFSQQQPYQGAITAGNSIQVPFAVGLGNNWGFYPILQKNTTYYFNVKNLTPNESCSNQGICDMFIELSKPSGL